MLAQEARIRVPGNSVIIDYFMQHERQTHGLDLLLAGVHASLDEQPLWNPDLFGRFKDYIDSEEAKIQKKLESVKYLVDADDTLRFVVGTARLEKVSAKSNSSIATELNLSSESLAADLPPPASCMACSSTCARCRCAYARAGEHRGFL